MNQKTISNIILNRLKVNENDLKKHYDLTSSTIGYFYIDNLLPNELATNIYNFFPEPKTTKLKKSLSQHKYVTAQMNHYNSLLEEVTYAFQDSRVVELVGQICDIKNLQPDDNLYAGGISMMSEGNFLNPHLDNSHDKDRNQLRALNLLYYVTPEWQKQYGGNLELWPNGPKGEPIEIEAKFNRLVVMATHNKSWHSVNKVVVDKVRCCVSNYYFTDISLGDTDDFHVTTFRGRPNQKVRNVFLKLDSFLRMQVRKVFKKGIRENPHVYKKDND